MKKNTQSADELELKWCTPGAKVRVSKLQGSEGTRLVKPTTTWMKQNWT